MSDTLVRKLIHPYTFTRAHVVDGPSGVITLSWHFDRKASASRVDYPWFVWDGDYYAEDLGIHARQPLYESSPEQSQDHCAYTDGPCWYDGTSLGAQSAARLYLANGLDALYDELEQWYHSRFDKEVSR